MSNAIYRIVSEKREDLRALELFVDIALNGIDKATKAVHGIKLIQKINEALGDPPPFTNEEALAKAKARAADVAQFAESEKSRGFPYLFGIASIRLWSLLEALVDDLAVEALKDPAGCKDQVLLSRLKGPLLEFRNASSDDQAEFLAETLKQAVEAALKQGIGKFESILEPIGLGGGIADSARKCLFELSHVRNAIVHKGGKADRKLIEACPWLLLTRGDQVCLNGKDFHRYTMAAYWYLLEIKLRYQFRGELRPDAMTQLQADLVTQILKLEADASKEGRDVPQA